MKIQSGQRYPLFQLFLLAFIILGIFFRFYQITENRFFFFDEGLYLDYNIDFLAFVKDHPPQSLQKFLHYITIMIHMDLADAKALWFFLANIRVFFTGVEGGYFLRVISALCGAITLGVTYLLARRYFNSPLTGLLSAALLAVLPSHVFYSQLGMQESFSTLCFTLGLYFYLFPRQINWRCFLSGFFFSLVFFTNYRMIIIPLLIGFAETFLSVTQKERFNLRKYLWSTLTFFLIVFMVGNIDRGANTRITFAWMFYQADLAQGHWDWLNCFSYPYYLFRLESVVWGLLFFGNLYYFWQRRWDRLFPFAFVLFQMMLFSIAQEKGARYLCAQMPVMALAVGALLVDLYEKYKGEKIKRFIMVGLGVFMLAQHVIRDGFILGFREDYKSSIEDVLRLKKNTGIISTQAMIQKMFVPDRRQVVRAPQENKYLLLLYARGYRYLIVDPQVYVSYTQDGYRFSPTLKGYLGFVTEFVKPFKVYPHFSDSLLERFVLEHNENLSRSLRFLRSNKDGSLGDLRVYRIEDCLLAMKSIKPEGQSSTGMPVGEWPFRPKDVEQSSKDQNNQGATGNARGGPTSELRKK